MKDGVEKTKLKKCFLDILVEMVMSDEAWL